MRSWSAASIDGLLPALSPQNEPGASGGNWPPGRGVRGVLASEGSPVLAMVTGVISRLGVASMPSGLPLASNHTIHNTLATNRWPWV